MQMMQRRFTWEIHWGVKMSEYVLRNIDARFIKHLAKKENYCSVAVYLPAFLTVEYRELKRGYIFVHKSCIKDAEKKNFKDVVLRYDTYELSVKKGDEFVKFTVSAEELYQENEFYLLLNEEKSDANYVEEIPIYRVRQQTDSPDYSIRMSPPPRLRKVDEQGKDLVVGFLMVHPDCVELMPGDKYMKVYLKHKSYSMTCDMAGNDNMRRFDVTRQEVIDMLSSDVQGRKKRFNSHKEDMAELVEVYSGSDDYLRLRLITEEKIKEMDDVRSTVRLDLPSQFRDEASTNFCTVIVPTLHIWRNAAAAKRQRSEPYTKMFYDVRLYAPQYEISFPITDTKGYYAERQNVRWKRVVVDREVLVQTNEKSVRYNRFLQDLRAFGETDEKISVEHT